jgi:hypothetical protein
MTLMLLTSSNGTVVLPPIWGVVIHFPSTVGHVWGADGRATVDQSS